MSQSDPSVEDRREFFEGRYVAADAGADGEETIPWDRAGQPNGQLAGWAAARPGGLVGAGRRAVVVGCGTGGDAEFLAGLGFDTVGFDFSATAIQAARRRRPDSPVRYLVADLLALPADWTGAYDLVLESLTVQSLPRSVRPAVIAAIRALVAPGGTLLVIANRQGDRDEPVTGPWPLSRADVDSFAAGELTLRRLEQPPGLDGKPRWRVEFGRH